jgi:hypothetical protein
MELDPGIHIGSTWFVLETGCDTHAGGGCGKLLDPRRVMGRVTGVEILAGGGCGFLPPSGFPPAAIPKCACVTL